MGGRAVLLVVTGLIALSAMIFLNMTSSVSDISTNGNAAYNARCARNIAESGVNLALRQIAANTAWRTGFPLMAALNGQLIVSARDTVYSAKPTVQIMSIGIMDYGNPSETRDTVIAYLAQGFVPAAVKGAVSTNNPVSTLGNLVVDGRDHTMSGALIAGQGTYGIWTTKTLSQSGNSKIGGHSGGADYATAKPANPNAVATNQTWPGGYPGTPDSVMGGASAGFSEGRLKAIAQSGIGGSQYVTNPAMLSATLKGVTYVELPAGGVWQSMNIQGSGILIVHNAAKNAAMKNLNSGTFTGLMIVDDPVHIHATIIGALVGLTQAPSEGNCIGNGNGTVSYSSQAITSATGLLGGMNGGGGSASGVLAWWE